MTEVFTNFFYAVALRIYSDIFSNTYFLNTKWTQLYQLRSFTVNLHISIYIYECRLHIVGYVCRYTTCACKLFYFKMLKLILEILISNYFLYRFVSFALFSDTNFISYTSFIQSFLLPLNTRWIFKTTLCLKIQRW